VIEPGASGFVTDRAGLVSFAAFPLRGPMHMGIFKGLSIIVAIGAVLALAYAGTARPPRLLALDRVNPAMNFAFVRVEGAVISRVDVAPDGGYLSFMLRDDSGAIRVTAYRQAFEQLRAAARIPRPGDLLVLDGTLRIRDDEAVLIVNAGNDVALTRSEALDVPLSAVDALQPGDRARTVGQLRAMRRVREGFWVLTLRDGTAALDVPLSSAVDPPYAPGDWLRVEGGIGAFRESKQLLVDDLGAITRAEPRPPDIRPIDGFGPDLRGTWVAVQGEVADVQPFKNGVRLVLQDESAQTIDVILFERVWQVMPISSTLAPGDVLQISGELGAYRGRSQIVPELAEDVSRVR
jgi:DNA/RNA endonuclease YhcR with UshA esterase domain